MSSNRNNGQVGQPNTSTWERIPNYSNDPIADLQIGIVLEEDYNLDPGDGIFLIRAMKQDHPIGRIFFREYSNPYYLLQSAKIFGQNLGLIKKEKKK